MREVRTSDGRVNEVRVGAEAEAAEKLRESRAHIKAVSANSWNQASTLTTSAPQDIIKTKEDATDVSSPKNLEESRAGEEMGRAASPFASSFFCCHRYDCCSAR